MAAPKCKKKKINERLSQNWKQEALGDYFCLEKISKLALHWIFQKTCTFCRLGTQPKTWNLDLIFFHMPFYIWTHYNIEIILGT